jgi:hypothetical protein
VTIPVWRPLLEGTVKERALETIAEIRRDLMAGSKTPTREGFAGGTSGLALLHAYLWRAGSVTEDLTLANQLLDQAICSLPAVPGLYSGFSGVGWVTAHLSKWLTDSDETTFEDIDRAVLFILERSSPLHFDLISGLVGYGVYALERLPHAPGIAILEQTVAKLALVSQQDPAGATWSTRLEHTAPWERELCKDLSTLRNLGLAHGVPGVIGFLGAACGSAVAETALPLVTSAVQWLLAQPPSNGGAEGFPSAIGVGLPAAPGRLAWCYGDPGVAITLLLAARKAAAPAWEEAALAIARRATRRPPERAGVLDAGLCHGTAGLAHIYNRLFQATGDAVFADAARFWFERTLGMCRPGIGIGGYQCWKPRVVDRKTVPKEFEWQDDPGFLTGSAGIALALLGATSSIEPAWDAVLLTNVPPLSA